MIGVCIVGAIEQKFIFKRAEREREVQAIQQMVFK